MNMPFVFICPLCFCVCPSIFVLLFVSLFIVQKYEIQYNYNSTRTEKCMDNVNLIH